MEGGVLFCFLLYAVNLALLSMERQSLLLARQLSTRVTIYPPPMCCQPTITQERSNDNVISNRRISATSHSSTMASDSHDT